MSSAEDGSDGDCSDDSHGNAHESDEGGAVVVQDELQELDTMRDNILEICRTYLQEQSPGTSISREAMLQGIATPNILQPIIKGKLKWKCIFCHGVWSGGVTLLEGNLVGRGPCWVLLDVVGHCWKGTLLEGDLVGCCWMLMDAVGHCWMLLDIVG